jgi:hypothetical protein
LSILARCYTTKPYHHLHHHQQQQQQQQQHSGLFIVFIIVIMVTIIIRTNGLGPKKKNKAILLSLWILRILYGC